MYLTLTTRMSDQMISERTPTTFVVGRRDAVLRLEALAERVQRARSDVAVDDAERGEGEQRRGAGRLRAGCCAS